MAKEPTPIQERDELKTQLAALQVKFSSSETQSAQVAADLGKANEALAKSIAELGQAKADLAVATAKATEFEGKYSAEKLAHDNLKADFEGKVIEAASKKAAEVVANQGLREPLKTETNNTPGKTEIKPERKSESPLSLIAEDAKSFLATVLNHKK